MTDQSIFRAAFSDFKLIRSRNCAQLVLEVPIEAADAALYALGGLPNPAAERWVAVARLNDEPPPAEPAALSAPEPKRWADMPPAQQAALRSGEKTFWRYLGERCGQEVSSEADAADIVRKLCAVESRKELNTDQQKRVLWHQLDRGFLEWSGRLARA